MHYLIMVDAHSKWPEVIGSMKTTTAESSIPCTTFLHNMVCLVKLSATISVLRTKNSCNKTSSREFSSRLTFLHQNSWTRGSYTVWIHQSLIPQAPYSDRFRNFFVTARTSHLTVSQWSSVLDCDHLSGRKWQSSIVVQQTSPASF